MKLMSSKTLKPGEKHKGSCNAQCYNAKSEHCTCTCNGLNHGVGLDKAIENTVKMMQETHEDVEYNKVLIDLYKAKGGDVNDLKLVDPGQLNSVDSLQTTVINEEGGSSSPIQ